MNETRFSSGPERIKNFTILLVFVLIWTQSWHYKTFRYSCVCHVIHFLTTLNYFIFTCWTVNTFSQANLMNSNILNFFLNCVLFLKTNVAQTGSLSQRWLVTAAAAASLNIAVKTSVVVADKLMGDVITALNFLFFFSCWKLLIVQMTSGFNSRDYY